MNDFDFIDIIKKQQLYIQRLIRNAKNGIGSNAHSWSVISSDFSKNIKLIIPFFENIGVRVKTTISSNEWKFSSEYHNIEQYKQRINAQFKSFMIENFDKLSLPDESEIFAYALYFSSSKIVATNPDHISFDLFYNTLFDLIYDRLNNWVSTGEMRITVNDVQYSFGKPGLQGLRTSLDMISEDLKNLKNTDERQQAIINQLKQDFEAFKTHVGNDPIGAIKNSDETLWSRLMKAGLKIGTQITIGILEYYN